ncbi:MAG: ornithine cyclodeaminase family protein [Nitrososphaeria archaeon]|nr:ornithine cyclodeaminase family protein [Nitrososphaeria archaeon]NIN52678.1 ornithine cyclodeaminase family protein [Nitrososphaeria archaeon]NIQ33153.1 ornithine cyclodeaminase family protein [Nitrososphaeria archaeon]
MSDAIEAVKEAYMAFTEGRVEMPPVAHLGLEKYGGEVDIKSGYVEDFGLIGTKIASNFWDNPKIGLPSGIAVIVLMDIKTSLPLALMDGTYVTRVRTGAAGAVAANVLARKNSKIVGVVGAGTQGRMQVLGLDEIFSIKKVKVYDIDESNREKYSSDMRERLGIDVQAVENPRKAVTEADIIVTASPSRKAIIMDDWIQSGVHINAIGADAPGKQELDAKIMKRAKIVVDSLTQCRVIGEIQHALSQGLIMESDIHAEIGEILIGKKKGRETDDEITIFDSTGLAAQDIAAAHVVYQLAKKRKMGKIVKLLK